MEYCSGCSKQQSPLLICGGCRNRKYCSRECQKTDWKQHRGECANPSNPQSIGKSNNLDAEEVEHILHTIRNNYLNVFKIIFAIDRSQADRFKERNLHYHSQPHSGHSSGSCCGGPMNDIYIPQSQMTSLETVIYELTNQHSIRSHLEELLQFCFEKLSLITSKGKQEGLQLDEATEKYLVDQTMVEGCQAFFLGKIRVALKQKSKVDAKQPMLMAIANTWYNKYPTLKLEFLTAEFISNVSNNGFAIDQHWCRDLPPLESLKAELGFFEKDGRFDELPSQQDLRNDRVMWLPSGLPPTSGFTQVVTKLYSIPFELTSKTPMVCSISESIQFSYFKANGLQKNNSTKDTGVKFTVLLPFEKINVKMRSLTNE